MRISYDPEIDALYIRLIEGKHECRTVRLNEEIALNIGSDEKLVGIEILDATEVLGQGRLPDVTLENIPPGGCRVILSKRSRQKSARSGTFPMIHRYSLRRTLPGNYSE